MNNTHTRHTVILRSKSNHHTNNPGDTNKLFLGADNCLKTHQTIYKVHAIIIILSATVQSVYNIVRLKLLHNKIFVIFSKLKDNRMMKTKAMCYRCKKHDCYKFTLIMYFTVLECYDALLQIRSCPSIPIILYYICRENVVN